MILFCTAIAFASPALVSVQAPSTWYVDVNATPPGNGSLSSPYASIQYAIIQSSTVSGDTLLVLPGTYQETFDYLGKSLAIKSTGGPEVTTLLGVAGNFLSTVRVQTGEFAQLAGFKLSNGYGNGSPYAGGAVRVQSSYLTLVDCIFSDNPAQGVTFGGAVYANDASLSVDGCVF